MKDYIKDNLTPLLIGGSTALIIIKIIDVAESIIIKIALIIN